MAKAELEAANANGVAADSYKALEKEMKATGLQIKMMSQAELNSANGKELIKKYNETNNQLKAIDASMGNYQRNVGNYASALQGLGGPIGNVVGKFTAIGNSAKAFVENMGGGAESVDKLGKSAAGSGVGLSVLSKGLKTVGTTLAAVGKAIMANPLIAVLAAALLIVITVIKQFQKAVADSEERQNKLSEATARFQPILRTIGDIFEVVTDVIISAVEWYGKAFAAVTEFLGINPEGSADAYVAAEKKKQEAILQTRKLNEDASKQEAIIEEQREILADKENYTYEQRVEALKKAGEAEKKLAADRQKIAELNLKALQAEAALDDNNAEMNDKLSAAIVAVNNARKESAAVGRKLAKEQQKLSKEHEADLKAEADAAKAAADKVIAARRRIIDIELSLLADSRDKALKLREEQYQREVQDAKRNGEYSTKLARALANQLRDDRSKINNEWDKKDLQDEIKANDLIISNMEKQGQDTLQMRLYQLQKQRELEEKEGGDINEIKLKYELLAAAETAKNADDAAAKAVQAFSKVTGSIKTQAEKDIIELKKSLAEGAISQEDYEAKVAKITADAARDANNAMIANLRKILENTELSAEKRAEYSDKLTELEIANENAAADAAIEANKKTVDSDKEAAAQRMATAEMIASQGMEMLGAIADFATQKSEQRIEELEAEMESNTANYESQQAALDNAIMSDETRAAKQKELEEKKAADELKIKQKIQAEKVKQAKWEKAQAIISASIEYGLGMIKAAASGATFGVAAPVAIPLLMGMMTAAYLLNVGTILSQKVPAYEHGGLTQGEPVSLWGEKRQEVAVTPSGEVYTASVPTLSSFDKGTRIYSSVADFERQTSFSFDYDRMANKIPRASVSIDYDRISTIVGNNGKYRALKYRRYN
ncbi:MAG TPA: hypothetical protein PLR63_07445 [Paludibacteraceae bacterium]|nr:hypothetical protein [Paludibacteraceae bacterium]